MTSNNPAMIATLLREIAQLEARTLPGMSPTSTTNTSPEAVLADNAKTLVTFGPTISGPVQAGRDVNIATQQTIINTDEHSAVDMEVRILAAFAQPRGTTATLWEQESRALRQAIAPFARKLRLDLLHGCTPDELHRTLLHLKPSIVHIQAHGNQDGLALQDSSGDLHQVSWAALRETLRTIPGLHCVILNACSSQVAATLGATPFALISTPATVMSEATLTFTFGFYDALAAGNSIPECYSAGCQRMRLQGYSADELPQISMSSREHER